MTINTGGGFYNSGEIHAQTVVGRDQYNYYFVGLAPLVHDPTRRFRNFLYEYLGTPDQPVPFGGRQAQLDELHGWLNDVDAPPYYLMSAEAGRGKSALVCRWMEEVRRQRPAVEVIFIPISIRFETAAQDVVFAALAARLAQIYDEPLKPAALSGAQWQGVCESYLDRTPPHGKQLLIILDGLDEATGWRFGAGFFSTNPPPGLRIVVTARLRVGESTPQGWAATLGWQERLTRMATLPPLTQIGVEEALVSMGDPLAGLADQTAISEQLYRLTEGDPLLVRLYVQEFEKQKTTVGTLTSAALQQMTPGLQGYFDQWWKGQKEQWRAQGSDPKKEEANLRLLLDALSAALGPLTLDDLANLHPELGSSRLIRMMLQSVERWVIGDGKAQGYSYSHSRLGYYFWEQLSDKEQREWDGRFCGWGAGTLAALNAEQLDPKAAPVYLLRHYGEHLERSHAPAEAFYVLVSNGWRLAWEWLDVSYGGFLGDVVRMQKNSYYVQNGLISSTAIVQRIKASLCQASIIGLGMNMIPNLLPTLVEHKLYTPIQALAIIKLISDEWRRVGLLEALAKCLPLELLEEVLAYTSTIADEIYRSRMLVGLAPYLPERLFDKVLIIIRALENEFYRSKTLLQLVQYLPKHLIASVWEIVQTIRDQSDYANTLNGLGSYLSPDLIKEILIGSRSITSDGYRATVLCGFAPYLPINLFGDALAITRTIQDVDSQVRVLNKLLPHLPVEFLYEALAIIQAIPKEWYRVDTLCNLIPYLPQPEQTKLLRDELERVQEIRDINTHFHAIGRLTSYFLVDECLPIFTSALKEIETLVDPREQTKALGCLTPHLPVALHQDALNIIHSLTGWVLSDEEKQKYYSERYLQRKRKEWPPEHVQRPEFNYVRALRNLAPYLSVDFLNKVYTIVLELKGDLFRIDALLALGPHLSQSQLHQALEVATKIKDTDESSVAQYELREYISEAQLQGIVTCTKMIQNWNSGTEVQTDQIQHSSESTLRKAWVIAKSIDIEKYSAKALCTLAPYLPEPLLRDALNVAQTMKDKDTRRITLNTLVLHLPEVLQKEMLVLSRTISDKSAQGNILRILAPQLPEQSKSIALLKAFTSARQINDERERAHALCELAPFLTEHQRAIALQKAFASACKLRHPDVRVAALIRVAPLASEELLGEIIKTLSSYDNEKNLASGFRGVAPYLSETLFVEALNIIHRNRIKSNITIYADALCELVPYLPTYLLDETLVATQGIKDAYYRATVLSYLAQRLPDDKKAKVLEDALTSARSSIHDYQRTTVLRLLIPQLRLEQRTQIVEELLTKAQNCRFPETRADELSSLIPQLPAETRSQVIENMLAAIPKIQGRRRQHLLVRLAPWLLENQRRQVFGEALSLISNLKYEGERSTELAMLVPNLPTDMLVSVLTTACTLRESFARTRVFLRLAPRLADWASDQPQQAYLSLIESLTLLSQRPRPDFLQDLATLMPFILALAGDEAPQAAEGIYHAIQEVCEWWP